MENKSSKLSASSEKKLATTELQNNGSYTDPMGLRKSKRFKVASGSRTVLKNKNVAGDCVPSSEAKVELFPGDQLENLFGVTGGDESHPVNILIQEQYRSELDMTEAVEVEPVSICWQEEDENSVVMGSFCRESTVGTKQLRGTSVTIVRHCSPYTGSKFSKRGETMEVAISMEEKKSDSGDHLGQSLAKSISPAVLVPLELDKSKVKAPKPVESTDRRNTRKGKANVELPPSRPSGSSKGDSARSKVKETLRLFYGACRKILQEEEARPRERKVGMFRVAVEASKIIKSQGKYLNVGTKIVGSVPGVEVGDEFQYRIELNFLGIHRPSQGGIDYMIDACGDKVATSIVSSGGYDDDLDNSDILTYTGQGGNVINKGNKNSEPKDQELVKGNLALANSKDKKNPVRVIRGNKATPLGSSADAKNYVYDGLYLVEEFWQETGSHGKMVFKFRLRRIPGQPELTWKVLKITKTSKSREGLCDGDISQGKERFPICAVNELDDEKPPLFTYTVDMIYPDWCKPIPPKGCGCKNRCSESKSCACVAKNGGELPYNHDGAIVNAKPLVYECGLLCKCPPSCYLRATQRGIKFQLEIFKTESRGWGVRSLNSIPCGSFICEYTGELLEEKEAERLAGNDEYLFDIGKDHEMGGFTIDAARKGNIGRFINHSCSPNLYAQDVLYDHDETRIPHVMLFAMDNIPPLVELSYFYNYTINQVRDSNGNIRKKNCYCGSSECTGRMY
uniref:Histone-lysine N-methyltransferase, H3 lysine-9 specific SUVH5 n=4 Tax=Noccaea caerulescens TaxID=107243 RepID=A0A1J3EM30_NOCCA